MYKTTADKQHDLARTGSHATKPLATGRVEVLPPEADPWAAIFNDVRTQRRIMSDNYEGVVLQLAENSYALRMSAEPKEQRGLLIRRQALIVRQRMLAERLADNRHEMNAAARACLGERFRFAARAMLLDEQYAAVLESAKELSADEPDLAKWADRNPSKGQGAKPTISELKARGAPEERLEAVRQRDRLKEKRQRLRRRLLGVNRNAPS